MTRPEKYKFQMLFDQFHCPVDSNFEDSSEKLLIDVFEQELLALKTSNSSVYTMLELGSNQCFYSLLFKHLLGKTQTKCFMVEPKTKNLDIGKQHFAANNCEGTFYHAIIGKQKAVKDFLTTVILDDVPLITLSQIFEENSLKEIDVLHSDIDGFEVDLLKENERFVKGNGLIY